ncbi:MAG: sigma 54-interacting transcriptional regulator [Myxococcales bacterium]|nr:sigma 54-interacting transcriptional regulator [Myxococcales bacterium]
MAAPTVALLAEVARRLAEATDPVGAIPEVLALLRRRTGLERMALWLLDDGHDEVRMVAADGYSDAQQRRASYRPGEGVTGRVVEDGAPAMIPRATTSAMFEDRTRARRDDPDAGFVCVPVGEFGDTLGALSADRPGGDDAALAQDAELLTVVAGLLAPALRRLRIAQPVPETDSRFQPPNIIGRSKGMQQVYAQVAQVASSEANVLLLGESGVGKELVAQAIHEASPRAARPFVKVNCAALPQSILESELFGHERGAFTGATHQRKGRFELAQGGTLFLDEIGDLPAHTQVALLRVLQEREFERVGGTETLRADVRLVTATHRDLEAAVADGTFRADLYYRLNVFPIHIPPLRERRADVMLLADHFVEKYAALNRKTVRRITTPAIDMLMAYHWPGNVRELENCIERAVIVTHDEVIRGHHLPPSLQTADQSGTTPRGSLSSALEALERDMIVDALKTNRGNMAAAARDLGLTERVMGLRVKQYDLSPRRFKAKRPR